MRRCGISYEKWKSLFWLLDGDQTFKSRSELLARSMLLPQVSVEGDSRWIFFCTIPHKARKNLSFCRNPSLSVFSFWGKGVFHQSNSQSFVFCLNLLILLPQLYNLLLEFVKLFLFSLQFMDNCLENKGIFLIFEVLSIYTINSVTVEIVKHLGKGQHLLFLILILYELKSNIKI